MKKYFCLCLLFCCASLIVLGCASFQETQKKEPLYRWSSFFNNGCGPLMRFELNSEDEAVLSYPCSNAIIVSQTAQRHQRQGEVDLWVVSDLPREQLYQLSGSKCRASLIYLGPNHATIKFPCALVHLTVTCDFVSTETLDATKVIHLQPAKALITFGDGTQQFRIEEDRLIPLGPFTPFRRPPPSFTNRLEDNQRRAFFCL